MENRVLKIKTMWPGENAQYIFDLLNKYGKGRHETGRERVQLEILKLANGDLEQFPELVKIAKSDFRDSLAYAEYPEETRTNPIEMRDMPKEDTKTIREMDRQPHRDWLED
ncbi:MAG: hypothetical protein JXA13_15520 [Anaerolineales bacterium]|nr:hypothetical protein [Anaerolineales bacterium]